MKTHMISYGNEKYAVQREFFKETALASNFFDDVKIFTPSDIDDSFKILHNKIWSARRGGGYWIWKPIIVNLAMKAIPDGDVLIFCDAGCMINRRGKKRFNEYIEVLMGSETGSVAFELALKEIEYTKQEIFNTFGSGSEIKGAGQTISGIMLFRKCKHASMLITKWNDIVHQSPILFTDYAESALQNPEYIENRHDQSVISVIRRTYGSEFIPDETYFLDFVRDGQNYPFWASRLSG